MAAKRKRGQNFSVEDKDTLINLLLQHKEAILNKKTDKLSNEVKNCAWISITNAFNSTSNVHRNKESLIKMWEKLKSEIKHSPKKANTTPTVLGSGEKSRECEKGRESEKVENLSEMLLREELEFKKKLYALQLEAAERDVEIRTAILEQIQGGHLSLNNLFGFHSEKRELI